MIRNLNKGAHVFDAVHDLGAVFAVRAQCVWLGGPLSLEARLLEWIQSNHVATASRDIKQTEAVAQAFDEIIHTALDFAQDNSSITQQLSNETIFNRRYNEVKSSPYCAIGRAVI